jgi:hypothetical protein
MVAGLGLGPDPRVASSRRGDGQAAAVLHGLAPHPGQQSLFVAVRNMFDEERIGAPGPIPLLPGRPPATPPTRPSPEKRAGVLDRLLGKKK